MRLRRHQLTNRRRDAETFLLKLRGLDDRLATRGYPRISDRWWTCLERFYRSGRRRLVLRKGRRVGASSIVAPRLAVAEALWGEHVHQPGSPPNVFAFVSVRRSEAANRLRGVRSILDVLGESYRNGTDSIELTSRPVIFQVTTASYRLSVGDTIAFLWLDEVARWRDEETGANPATEVVAALAPSLITLPDARMFLVSSPLTEEDFHAQQFKLGDTDHQLVDHFSTWEGNPTVTREELEKEQPDPRIFDREFAAIPSGAASVAFEGFEHLVERGVDERKYERGTKYGVVFDLGENKSHTVALVFHFEARTFNEREIQRVLVVDVVHVLKPSLFKLRKVSFSDQVRMVRELCARFRVTDPWGDRQAHSPFGEALAPDLQIGEPAGMGLADQARRSQALIDRVRAGTIDLVDDDDLLKQIRTAVLRERGGHFVVQSPNKTRQPDDALDCLLLACDEQRFQRLPSSGSGGVVRMTRSIWGPGAMGQEWKGIESFWVRQRPDGTYERAAPPPDSRAAKLNKWRRWAEGTLTPEESASGRSLEDFKDEASRGLRGADV